MIVSGKLYTIVAQPAISKSGTAIFTPLPQSAGTTGL